MGLVDAMELDSETALLISEVTAEAAGSGNVVPGL
jgi:hypothetical protein